MNKIRHSALSLSPLRGVFILVLTGFVAGFVAYRCTYPFEPALHQTQEMLVVDGHIIKGDKVQTIKISRSSAYNNYKYYPEVGCLVRVVDGSGKHFSFAETGKGVYTSAIPDELIKFNTTYQLFITTPDNQNYESTPELLFQAAPVDSLYYFEELKQTVLNDFLKGVQFYVDIKAKQENARYYRWILEETWEYRRKYPIMAMWDASLKMIITLPEEADSLKVCYVTNAVEGLYSSSTVNLRINEKKRIPLNFVSNETPRLEVKYCLLVKQYPLSESVYNYFNTKKNELQESGGLYETQPVQTISNMINSDHPDEKVLGYFWASSYTAKRVFATPPPQFGIKPYCDLTIINWKIQIGTNFYVIYIMDNGSLTADDMCFDCTKTGGVTKKPDYWK